MDLKPFSAYLDEVCVCAHHKCTNGSSIFRLFVIQSVTFWKMISKCLSLVGMIEINSNILRAELKLPQPSPEFTEHVYKLLSRNLVGVVYRYLASRHK